GVFDSVRYSGGDAEFCRRAARHGVEIAYCERALIRHPARNSWKALAGKARRVKGGQVKDGSWSRRLLNAARTFLPPVRAWATVVRSKKVGKIGKMYVCAIQARLWCIEMAEVIFLALGGAKSRR